MPIRAKLTALRTRPYRPDELAQMAGEERERYGSGYYENILGEDIIQELTADSPEELGKRVSEIAEERKPHPIVLITPQADELPLKHMYLAKRAYVRDDEQRMFELIVFGPKDPMAWKEKTDKASRERQPKPASPAEQQVFMQKAVKRMMGEMEKTIMHAISKPPEGLGFASMDEFRTFFEENKKRFATDREFNEFYRAEMKSRTEKARAIRREELVRKPPYYASQIPSTLNQDMTVYCRIIGKDEDAVYKHFDYYKSFHKMSEPVFVIDNGADDGTHVSFIYRKDAEDPAGEPAT